MTYRIAAAIGWARQFAYLDANGRFVGFTRDASRAARLAEPAAKRLLKRARRSVPLAELEEDR